MTSDFLTFAGFATIGAAFIALFGVLRTSNAENARRQRAERIEAFTHAIDTLNASINDVRSRHIAYAAFFHNAAADNPSVTVAAAKDKGLVQKREKARERHAHLHAAKARLTLVGMNGSTFKTAHDAINEFGVQSWHMFNPSKPDHATITSESVWEREDTARKAINTFGESAAATMRGGQDLLAKLAWIGVGMAGATAVFSLLKIFHVV